MDYIIREETEKDFREVEEMIKRAFWNVNAPGCDEHYFAHIIRSHTDFIRELDLVLEIDGKIIANIMYTKCKLMDENGFEKDILTFGPLSVMPEYQRKGYGKALQQASFKRAAELNYDTVVIFGNPENYIPSGFKSCRKYNVTIDGEHYPTPLLVKELVQGALDGRKWTYKESPAFIYNPKEAESFDSDFEPMVKEYRKSQELFYIYSRSQLK